jgi:hypothetical protein
LDENDFYYIVNKELGLFSRLNLTAGTIERANGRPRSGQLHRQPLDADEERRFLHRSVYDTRIPCGAPDSKINPNVLIAADRRFRGSYCRGASI